MLFEGGGRDREHTANHFPASCERPLLSREDTQQSLLGHLVLPFHLCDVFVLSTPLAHESVQNRGFRPIFWLCGTNEPSESLEYHDRIVERRLGCSSTGTSTSTCGVICNCHWRQQGWRALNYRHRCFHERSRQHEQEAHDRTEVTFAEAAAQTKAEMLHEWFRSEQVAEKHSFKSALGDSQSDALGSRKTPCKGGIC